MHHFYVHVSCMMSLRQSSIPAADTCLLLCIRAPFQGVLQLHLIVQHCGFSNLQDSYSMGASAGTFQQQF